MISFQKTSDDIFLIHINAISLISNYDRIVNTLTQFKALLSLIFISETKLHDSKLNDQLPQVRIDGYQNAIDL